MENLFNKGFQSIGVDIKAESAGIAEQDGKPISEFSLRVLKENGIDASSHKSRCLKNLNLDDYERIYCVDKKTKDAVVEAGAKEANVVILNEKHGGIPNPYEKPYEEYEICYDTIEKSVNIIIGLVHKAM